MLFEGLHCFSRGFALVLMNIPWNMTAFWRVITWKWSTSERRKQHYHWKTNHGVLVLGVVAWFVWKVSLWLGVSKCKKKAWHFRTEFSQWFFTLSSLLSKWNSWNLGGLIQSWWWCISRFPKPDGGGEQRFVPVHLLDKVQIENMHPN